MHGSGCPGSCLLFDCTPGREDGDYERRHYAVQAGGERAAAAQMDMASAERDRLYRAYCQRGESADDDKRVHAGIAMPSELDRRFQKRPSTDDFNAGR